MLSLNPVDWLEWLVRFGVDVFEKGMIRLADFILSLLPRWRKPRRYYGR